MKTLMSVLLFLFATQSVSGQEPKPQEPYTRWQKLTWRSDCLDDGICFYGILRFSQVNAPVNVSGHIWVKDQWHPFEIKEVSNQTQSVELQGLNLSIRAVAKESPTGHTLVTLDAFEVEENRQVSNLTRTASIPNYRLPPR